MSVAPVGLLLTASLLACGAQPIRPVLVTPQDTHALPRSAVRVVGSIQRVDALLERLDGVLDDDALGALGGAWRRSRAHFEDVVAEMGGDARVEAWGLRPARPVVLSFGAPTGAAMGRALLNIAQGRAVTPPAVVWHGRLVVGVVNEGHMRRWLDALAARMGAVVGVLPQAAWSAQDPESGVWVGLRFEGGLGVLDAVRIRRGATAVEARAGWTRATARRTTRSLQLEGVVEVEVSMVDLSALGVALNAVRFFEDPDPALVEAAAEVTAACSSRWRALGEVASQVRARVLSSADGVAVEVTAALTPQGEARWAEARRARPLNDLDDLSLGLQFGWAPESFESLLGGRSPMVWFAESRRCAVGSVPALAVAVVTALPAFARPSMLPVPSPPGGFPDDRADGLAAAVLGFDVVQGEAIPQFAVLHAQRPAPSEWALGEAATVEVRDGWRRHTRAGMHLTTGWATRPYGAGHQVAYAVGTGALERWTGGAASDEGAAGAIVFEAALDPSGLSEALHAAGEAGPGVVALDALKARVGRVEMVGALRAGALHLRLTVPLRPSAPRGGEAPLDP